MNNEEQKAEVKQMMDSLVCEHLNDEKFCLFHRAVLELISTAVKVQTLFLPMDLYCNYKGFVELSCKMLQKRLPDNQRDLPFADLDVMYLCYRSQAETQYRILCGLIVSTYQNTTIPEERETLKSVIDGIRNITRG